MNKIALFTIALGKDPIYIESIKKYMPYTLNVLMKNAQVDCFLFIDKEIIIENIKTIKCTTIIWPYIALLKNNLIADFLSPNKWNSYSHIFFIDADFALGKEYTYCKHNFIFPSSYWNNKIAGGFYGCKTELFKILSNSFYQEIKHIHT